MQIISLWLSTAIKKSYLYPKKKKENVKLSSSGLCAYV